MARSWSIAAVLVTGLGLACGDLGEGLEACRAAGRCPRVASPATSSLSVASPRVPSDGVTPAVVTVTVRDAEGRPSSGNLVSLSYSGAASVPPARASDLDGGAVFALVASAPTQGTLTATVDGTALSGATDLTFLPVYGVGGQASFLSSDGLVLQSPGLDDLSVSKGAASFGFARRVLEGTAYSVTVKTQPSGAACVVVNGEGVVGHGDVTQISVSCAPTWLAVSGGRNHTLAVKRDGTLWAWGDDSMSQLGDGQTAKRPVPVKVGEGFVQVAAGSAHSAALADGGAIYTWGHGPWLSTAIPTPTSLADGFSLVVAGFDHFLAIRSDGGTLWSWGANDAGQLGDGTTTNRPSPVQVGKAGGYVALAGGGAHSLAVKSDGTLWSWGLNDRGQLGKTGVAFSPSPARLDWDGGFVAVGAGEHHSLALRADGTVWAWGANDKGQVGNSKQGTDQPIPVQVATGIRAIASGYNHSAVITTDGGVVSAWGWNIAGQVGDDSQIDRYFPLQVAQGIQSAALGGFHSMGLKDDGTLWVWGSNLYDQIGFPESTSVQKKPVILR